MKDWNRFLIKKAEPIVEKLKKFPEVKAIAFYGSIGAGHADEFSDIDLAIFCTKKPSLKASRHFYKELGIKMIKGPFDTGFHWNGCEWTIWIELIKDMEKYINSFLRKEDIFWKSNMEQKFAFFFDNSRVAWDPDNLLKKWAKKVRKYPRWLKKINLERLQFAANKIEKLEKSMKRNNSVLVLDSLNLIVITYAQIIYALNEKFYPYQAWFLHDAKKFRIMPKNCLKRMEMISSFDVPLAKKLVLIKEMFGELEILCRKQVPDLQLTRSVDG